ncbi:cell cycle transcriptional regulator TrcR [Candidatus Sneabacter namystus]|uniref:DUF1013 domain-containing protein n=1 Tax=Candidatus Sneabacter namystus TaxID=2601646 RepID=A0A5C0UIS5_9RICK|nr:cell cycle transcriptional regulator TrcR [Candidatus Sneabacter namystus]QEK39413.1 DUF1013 domain-containing protein [Candidatus Sneabacter namystus]
MPLMPKATAMWLIENTSLSFEQIADFCALHPLEVQAIADGESGNFIGVDPVLNKQLSKEEIDLCEKDPSRKLRHDKSGDLPTSKKKYRTYVPIVHRQNKANAVLWLLKHNPDLSDNSIAKLVRVAKNTVSQIRNKTYWNYNNLIQKDPVALNLCSQKDLIKCLEKNEAKKKVSTTI